ncbi:hypothetical protein ACGFX7_06115 [Streptomyces harbinensis]|uniref:hypothetical protein n=1 Tax=Streptomyces harbinensis TaxID=1176198 RepID=UPI00371C03EE
MSCCGRTGRGAARPLSQSGQPVAWRHYQPSGGSVDYPDEARADHARDKIGGTVTKIDARTGAPIE